MMRAHFRCNSGHYFSGGYCQLEGWSSTASKQLAEVVERLAASRRDPSLAELRRAGLDSAALQRTIVVQFGAEGSIFEALAPEGYVIDGEWRPLDELDGQFK